MSAPFCLRVFKAYQIKAPQKGLLRESNVRFGSKADILRRKSHVCFTPESGQ
jgi:hypothetical protein